MSLPLSTPTRHRRVVASALGACLWLAACGAQAQAPAAADPRGRWISESGNLEVEIAPCGAALCGIATRVLGNRSMSPGAQPMQAVDTRPALGMKILQDFVPVAAGHAGTPPAEWTGQIYNRENGKTYHCNMRVSTDGNAAGELLLHPYVGLPLFGKTQRWLRASADAPDAPATTVRH